MSDTLAPAPTPAPAPAPAPVPAATWYAGANLDAETVGYLQNRGWDKDVNVAALGAVKAHREAEQHLGVPADRIIRLPKDANDEAGWKAVWNKLGTPADEKGYDFSTVKRADGSPLNPAEVERFSKLALKSNLSKPAAAEFVKSLVAVAETTQAEAATTRAHQVAEQQAALAKEWGTSAPLNQHHADTAATRLGLAPEQVAALNNALGVDKAQEMLRKVGQHIGEDRWEENPRNSGGGSQVFTREQALARKTELLSDPDWTTKWQNGSAAHNKEMLNLNSIIVGAKE